MKPLAALGLFILLLNFKSLPFLWHIRLFQHTFRIALYRLILGRTTLRALPKNTPSAQILFKTVTHTHRNLLDDTDFFWHMSNSVYNKVFDFVRMDLLCQIFPDVIYNTKKQGITMMFGGSGVVFIREIPMLATYKLHARVISWSTKWLYVQGVFTLPASSRKRTAKRIPTNAKTGESLSVILNNVNADTGMESGSMTPSVTNVATTTINGEPICAVIYGRYVFKRKTRETVPVNEALGICGFNVEMDGEIERRRKEGWEYVSGLEHDWDKDRGLKSAADV